MTKEGIRIILCERKNKDHCNDSLDGLFKRLGHRNTSESVDVLRTQSKNKFHELAVVPI